ncbi:hypothetical protein BCR33DRAFT_786367 [Rhizoclosmatium globosum]|uniref:F-box domain-containing protein n=1 Tax=Rhizoclosmatium globosum TaxID=329046 RepID=A0A1Y2C6T6_9FUNG|nr:hypothetical protein BCR33DRAFT_786367 [Rhizoclosmatium globosum]|eukprot:ORY42656.1 hypothetical protein BCR33DRAFT_786367 [Rhizoclosmatium globosum]
MLNKLPREVLGAIQLLVRLEDALPLGMTCKALLPVLTDSFMAKKHIDARRKLDGPRCRCEPGHQEEEEDCDDVVYKHLFWIRVQALPFTYRVAMLDLVSRLYYIEEGQETKQMKQVDNWFHHVHVDWCAYFSNWSSN